MASSTTSNPASRATGVIVQSSAWGYVPLDAFHPGVQSAKARLLRADIVNWDLMAEIKYLAGRAADDLVIIGGVEVDMILRTVQDALVMAALAQRQ